ncbi:unnamed protein product [Arabidopsis thaliana]|nr:unnamed protein product [Arabidopsis thaliana]
MAKSANEIGFITCLVVFLVLTGQSNGMSNGMPRTVPCIEGRILWNRTLPCSSILCGDHCVPHGYRAGTCDIVNDRAICKCSRCR